MRAGLEPLPENEQQTLEGNTKFKRPGIYFESVVHYGNQNSSMEEIEIVKQIVHDLLGSGLNWINSQGEKERIYCRKYKDHFTL